MKKILVSLMVVAMVATMLGLGIFAQFRDIDTSSGNYVEAGSLNLKIDNRDGPDDIGQTMKVTGLQPGETRTEEVSLRNAGSCPGTADFHILGPESGHPIVNDENTCIDPEQDAGDDPASNEGELCKYLKIKISYDGVAVPGGEGYLTDLACQNFILGDLPAGVTKTLTIEFSLDFSAETDPDFDDDVIQTDRCLFDVEYSLDQVI